MKVSKETILKCISGGCSSIEEVSSCTNAGSCCTACHIKIKHFLKEVKDENRNKEAESSKEGK
jgi:NAD(P)H-nitrite reductase large subunit